MKVGLGFDVHRFTKRKKSLLLAGININCGFGIEAVSDGDVVIHAICDAILGAASLGDIGDYFPPQHKESKGLKSVDIALFVLKKIKGTYSIENIDATIIADKPPLAKYKPRMAKFLSKLFNASINIKIKSKEGLNIMGGSEAIACYAVALLKKNTRTLRHRMHEN